MKTAGIFTYMQSNYGAILQAFSLQNYLRENGVDAEVVDFTTPHHTVDYHLKESKLIKILKTGNMLVDMAILCLNVIRYPQLYRRKQRSLLFKQNNFYLTKRYHSTEEVLADPPQKDLLISGSDQIFNLNKNYTKTFYLAFDKKKSKKIAYAPSFGVSSFDSRFDEVKPYLQDFDYLSCREAEGAKFMEGIVGHYVPTVVDPVLLHDANFWSRYAVPPKIKDKYILVYNLNGKKNLMKIASWVKKNTGYKIVCLTGDIKQVYTTKMVFDAGPAEFIGWFKNASFVVTDSFHGTVFSLIFSKQFYSFVAVEKTSSRVKNLLSSVGLTDRIIKMDEISERIFSDIDYSNVDLDSVSKTSKKFIADFIR